MTAERFGVDFESTKDEWQRIDRELLIAERNAIFGQCAEKWTGEDQVVPYKLSPAFYTPEQAREVFLATFGNDAAVWP